MYNLTIKLNPARVNFPLPPLYMRQGCDAHLLFQGVPATATGIRAMFWAVGDPVPAIFDVTDNALWVPATIARHVGCACYEIIADFPADRHVWLGRGVITITPAHTAPEPPGPVTPADPYTYDYDPTTERWFRRIAVPETTTGIIVSALDQTPYIRDPVTGHLIPDTDPELEA